VGIILQEVHRKKLKPKERVGRERETMSNLLIVESPAKCQKIRSFLGSDWNVVATMGHIRALEETLDAIGLENGFRPKYQWIKEKAKAIQQLKQSAEKATTIYLASDDDREGEMISYSVCLLLKCSPEHTPRIVFHEITEKAIRHAISNPRRLDMNRVEAQQARAMLDMMIGFTMSPLLWKHVAPTLSAGRCQTPALRLVIEREDAIQTFVSTASWQMEAAWLPYSLSSPNIPTWMEDELEDEESVQQVMEHARDHSEGTLRSSHQTEWFESPPDPLMTSTLQQQASQLYHCSPKQTMSIAQRLYEAGHITYMRTDKAVMSEEAKEEARKWVTAQYGEAYIYRAETAVDPVKKSRRPKTKGKDSEKKESTAQEAHEAIRPTHMEVTTLSSDQWGPSERKIYELISRRALQSVMAPARGRTLHLQIELDELEDFPWKAEYKRMEFDGWKRLGAVASLEEEPNPNQNHIHTDEDEKESKWDQWNSLKVGDRMKWSSISGREKETRSQTRFTEATLVRELERHGIGRPSTFASLLSVIQDKKYVEVTDLPPTEKQVKEYEMCEGEWPYRIESKKKKVGAEKRKLIPTALGRSVWEWMQRHFDDLFAYDFTGTMEKQLDHIAEGIIKRPHVLQVMWESYRERYESLSKVSSLPRSSLESTPSSKQRIFLGGLKAVQTKKGPLLLREGVTKEETVFLGWPKGVSWDSLTEEDALSYEKSKKREQFEKDHPEEVGEWRDKSIHKKTGPYGTYLQWGSVNLPWIDGEDQEALFSRLEKKVDHQGPLVVKEWKQYIIRNGQYGPYIMKRTATQTKTKKPVCVSLPKGIEVEKLTEKEVDGLYKLGLEQKKKTKKE